MISMIQRWFFGPNTFKPDIPMMAECRHCEMMVRHRAANRLTVHLIYDHKLPDLEAYKMVDWVFTRMVEHLRSR